MKIKYHKIVDLSKDFWVACSGGADSIAVAHFFHKLQPHILHFNHKMRPQNDEMEKSVREFSKRFNMACTVFSSPHSLTSESEAREWRLTEIRKLKGQVIFAHHLDDCVESYLMNCFKGTPEYIPIPIKTDFENASVIRPFMSNSKHKLHKYINYHGLNEFVVVDETNTDTAIRRNWIRHEVRQVIEKQYPGISKVVRKKVLAAYEKYKMQKMQSEMV